MQIDDVLELTYIGSHCPTGWVPIVEEAFEKLAKLDSWDPKKVAQVKQKLGTLRIYLDFRNEEVDTILREAEDKAQRTCEFCAEPGKSGVIKGYLCVVCDTCESKGEKLWR